MPSVTGWMGAVDVVDGVSLKVRSLNYISLSDQSTIVNIFPFTQKSLGVMQ